MALTELQYQSDEQGVVTAVVVPIAVWHEITSELETHYLLKSDAMRQRLLRAKARSDGLSIDDVPAQLDVAEDEI